MAGVNSLFVKVHRWAEGNLTIFAFLASLFMLGACFILFAEDLRTSYLGLQEYEQYFDLAIAIWPITYWAQALLPQVGQVLLFYVFFSDMKKNWWALLGAILLLLIDFYADLFHRTKGTLTISSISEGRSLAGGAITLFYFTIGCEFFLSMSWGIALETMAPAIKTFKQLVSDQKFALGIGNPQPQRSSSSNRRNGSMSPEEILTGRN